MTCQYVDANGYGFPVGKCFKYVGMAMRADCPTTVKIWNATDCAGTEMTDQELLASFQTTRTEFEAGFTIHGCGNSDCEFVSYGQRDLPGQDCGGAGTTWHPHVLDKCEKKGVADSMKWTNCANDKVDIEDYYGSTDCSSGLSTTNSTAEGYECIRCGISEVVVSGGAGGGDGGTPTAPPVSSSMPRFKGLTSAGLLAIVTVALAIM